MDRHWGHLKKWKTVRFFFIFTSYLNVNKHSIKSHEFDQFDQFKFFSNHLIIFFYWIELFGIRWLFLSDQSYDRVVFFISFFIFHFSFSFRFTFPAFSLVCIVLLLIVGVVVSIRGLWVGDDVIIKSISEENIFRSDECKTWKFRCR